MGEALAEVFGFVFGSRATYVALPVVNLLVVAWAAAWRRGAFPGVDETGAHFRVLVAAGVLMVPASIFGVPVAGLFYIFSSTTYSDLIMTMVAVAGFGVAGNLVCYGVSVVRYRRRNHRRFVLVTYGAFLFVTLPAAAVLVVVMTARAN